MVEVAFGSVALVALIGGCVSLWTRKDCWDVLFAGINIVPAVILLTVLF